MSACRAELDLPDLAATHALGRRLAGVLRGGDQIGLSGPLGSGKTELARAVIRAKEGAEVEVPSPSFTLVQDYTCGELTIRHVDLFRIERAGELVELGLDVIPSDEVWLVEWPERAPGLLAEDHLSITLDQADAAGARLARLDGGPSWHERMAVLMDG